MIQCSQGHRAHSEGELTSAAANYTQSFSYRDIRRAPRRQVGKKDTTPASSRIVAPGAIGRQARKQIVQQNFRSEFHYQSCEPIRTSPFAKIAVEPNEHVGEISQAP
jgi:hypothetical protein